MDVSQSLTYTQFGLKVCISYNRAEVTTDIAYNSPELSDVEFTSSESKNFVKLIASRMLRAVEGERRGKLGGKC